MRYLGFNRLDEVDRLTIPEYKLLMKAERYRQVDRDFYDHRLAYLIFAATAKKKSGRYGEKPVYSTFRKFFDYDKAIKELEGRAGDNRFRGIGQLLKEQEERRKNGGDL